MLAVEYSPLAEADLLELVDRVSDLSIPGAHRLLDEIIDAVDRLRRLPESGHRHAGLSNPEHRVVAVRGWLVIYRVEGRLLKVCRIAWGARDLSRMDIP